MNKLRDLETVSEGKIRISRSLKIEPGKNSRRENAKNRKKRSESDNFIAPDGGWGWFVVIAAAISILVTFDVFEQLESLFKQKWKRDGISETQMKNILNLQHVAVICTALFNDEIFRNFTFRLISFAGAIFLFAGLALSLCFNSLILILLSFSIMCGIGKVLIFSSSYIAVNTYFDENRRSAVACMCSIIGLGPLILPYLTLFLKFQFGNTWTLLFYTVLSLQNFVSSLVYQPVEDHCPKNQRDIELAEFQPLNFVLGPRQLKKLAALESASSSNNNINILPSNFPMKPLRVPKNSLASFEPLTKPIPKIILPDETEYCESSQEFDESTSSEDEKRASSLLQRTSKFIDLDLLKHMSFINLILGLALIQFVELNFMQILPFILNEFDLELSQIGIALALMALTDLLVRMSIPLVTRKLKYSNKVALLWALLGICIGRVVLVFNQKFTMILICLGWIGLCSAVKTVSWMLTLPSSIELKRLPAAIGFQQVAFGFCMLTLGQFRDLFEDGAKHNFVLLFMNAICLFVGLAWIGEYLAKKKTEIEIEPIK